MRFTFIIFLLFSTNCFAQQKSIETKTITATVNNSSNSISNVYIVKSEIQNNKLFISWPVQTADVSLTWEVQGSVNGKDFKTLGLVWGADEKRNICTFKQEIGNLSSNYAEYRVIKYENLITKN